MVFDLMPTDGERRPGQRRRPARRRSPAALDGYARTLLRGAAAGHVSARAQLVEVAKQCALDRADPAPATTSSPGWSSGCRGRRRPAARSCERHAAAATAATAEFGRFLRDELAPPRPGQAGRRPGALRARLPVLPRRQGRPGRDLRLGLRGAGPPRGRDGRGRRPDRAPALRSTRRSPRSTPTRPGPSPGKEAFRDWMQAARRPKAITELHGTHFDIPEQVRRIECCIAPDQRRRHLLHRAERGLHPPGPDVVGGAAGHRRRSPPGGR